ncbi:MAG TPA: hypothetical protein VHL11_07700 [Phototrophicaceae bacterium]|nr:hypothetical protein [Phototrophicaceae bacterium]
MTKSSKWSDIVIMLLSLVVIGGSILWMLWSTKLFDLNQDTRLSWHLIRATAISGYLLVAGSTIWGLFVSSQLVKNWSPGIISMSMHSAMSWLGLLLGLVHALLLLTDKFFTYTLADIFVPFTGPYRPEAVGLGTLAFWVILLVSISFWFKKQMGHRAWKWLHLTSYIAFAMLTLHAIFAGTDGQLLGLRLVMGTAVMTVITLLIMRVRRDQTSKKPAPAERPARMARGQANGG